MPVSSMTGFARSQTQAAGMEIAWELRSVNGKGLDLRLRLPTGLDPSEAEIRRILSAAFSRGNLQAALSLQRTEAPLAFQLNETLLAELTRLSNQLVRNGHASMPTADGLLALRGVVEVAEREGVELDEAAATAVLLSLHEAVAALAQARQAEGAALRAVLERRLDEIAALADAAEADPARRPDVIRDRLRMQVEDLVGASGGTLEPERLYVEAALLATRADIREELDRLHAHVEAARELLRAGGPVGRRLEFLSQEFNRESNTLCSKSNATSLTAIGLQLKVVVDQFREQVQNLE